jgi:hypothetical protein
LEVDRRRQRVLDEDALIWVEPIQIKDRRVELAPPLS